MRLDRFQLIDRVVRLDRPKKSIVCRCDVPMESSIFEGHFPGDPIMPGVLQVEAMAQTAAVLIMASLRSVPKGSSVYFASIESARFRRPVRPGDRVHLDIAVLRSKLSIWKFAGKALVDGETAAEAEFAAKLLLGSG